MIHIVALFLAFLFSGIFIPQAHATGSCFMYFPVGSAYQINYCPTESNPWPHDIDWSRSPQQAGTYQPSTVNVYQNVTVSTYVTPQAPSYIQPSGADRLMKLNDYIRHPERYTYWRKTQALTGENGKELGAVFVQRKGNTLEVAYELTSYKCQLQETKISVTDTEDRLPWGWNDFGYSRGYGNHYTASDTHFIDVSRWSPDRKMFIAAYARVRCEGGSGRAYTKYHDAWAGPHGMPHFPNASYITYKAAAADNPPVAVNR